jgi:uncharacterized protein YodC (DUF2158 family)
MVAVLYCRVTPLTSSSGVRHRCSWYDGSGSGRLVERETENEVAPRLPVRVEIE